MPLTAEQVQKVFRTLLKEETFAFMRGQKLNMQVVKRRPQRRGGGRDKNGVRVGGDDGEDGAREDGKEGVGEEVDEGSNIHSAERANNFGRHLRFVVVIAFISISLVCDTLLMYDNFTDVRQLH